MKEQIINYNDESRMLKIVCLCGSTRFYTEFQEANYQETMAGNIVLSVGFYPHSQEMAHGEDKHCTPEQKLALDDLHKKKISISDEVYVINVDGYIGESTKSEIEYAISLNKPIRFLDMKSWKNFPTCSICLSNNPLNNCKDPKCRNYQPIIDALKRIYNIKVENN